MTKIGKMKKSKRAEIGVGTLIIFIAMILVAAVAASVLISTANSVREQAESTGSDAINNVASGFMVTDVIGYNYLGQNTNISSVSLYARLAAGSPAVNISDVIITLQDESNSYVLVYASSETTNSTEDNEFYVDWKHIAEGMDDNYVGQGDLIEIDITGLNLDPRTHVTITIMPESGAETVEEFTTPPTYLDTYINLG